MKNFLQKIWDRQLWNSKCAILQYDIPFFIFIWNIPIRSKSFIKADSVTFIECFLDS